MRRRGLSLLETVLSFCIVALMVVMIFSLYPAAMSTVRLSGQKLQADALADSLLEQYQAAPFDSLAPGSEPSLPPVDGQGTRFQPVVQFEEVSDPEVDAGLLRRIRVSVSWTEHGMTRARIREVVRARVQR